MIPNKFKLLNYTWTVVLRSDPTPWVDADGDRQHGECDPNTRTITLDGSLDSEALFHVWLHELTHAILGTIGRSHLNADEDFVDTFSGALAQAVQTCD